MRNESLTDTRTCRHFVPSRLRRKLATMSDPTGRMFTADEVIEIANETSDSLGNLYRLDFIDRINHESRPVPSREHDEAAASATALNRGEIPEAERGYHLAALSNHAAGCATCKSAARK